jgi:glycosyltransferase involved in cell wall biosynthesis
MDAGAKVLQVLYSGLGGHGSVAFSLADTARDTSAWANQFVFLGIEPVLPAYRAKCEAQGYPCQEVRSRRGFHWLSWLSLYRAVSRLKPDAIVLHSVKAILPVALYASRHAIPLIAVEHQPNTLKSRREWWVSRWLQRWAGAVVVLTPDYRTDLQAALGDRWRAEKIHVIPNGIDVDLFSPADRKERPRPPCVIGMAARMTRTKRQEVLIDALASLRARGQDWRLSLAGDGERIAALRARAERLGLEHCVEFTGYLGEAELLDWFRGIDFYAHASNGETLSTSLLQALAMGLPIVASDVPGISDLLGRGGGVGVLAPQSADAFAEALRDLSARQDHARELRLRARRLAEAEYSRDAMFRRYDRVLELLCPR